MKESMPTYIVYLRMIVLIHKKLYSPRKISCRNLCSSTSLPSPSKSFLNSGFVNGFRLEVPFAGASMSKILGGFGGYSTDSNASTSNGLVALKG